MIEKCVLWLGCLVSGCSILIMLFGCMITRVEGGRPELVEEARCYLVPSKFPEAMGLTATAV
jgi:hypothetical protein